MHLLSRRELMSGMSRGRGARNGGPLEGIGLADVS